MVGRSMTARLGWVALGVFGAAAALAGPQAFGTAAPAAKAAQDRAPNLVVARFGSNDAKGIVYAVRRGHPRRVTVAVSLHSLDPNKTFVVGGATKPCTTAVAPADVVFRVTARSVETESIWVPQGSPVRGSMRNVRSIRIFEETGDGTIVQAACARAAVFIGGGAATGALV